MFLEVLFALLLIDPSPAKTVETTAEPGWLATVRHFTLREPNWALHFREVEPGAVSVSVWWVVGSPVHKGLAPDVIHELGFSAEAVPDHVESRFVKLTVADCQSLATVTRDLGELTIPPAIEAPPAEDTGYLFELETPGREPVDLTRFAASDPLVRWANRAWDELSRCAEDFL